MDTCTYIPVYCSCSGFHLVTPRPVGQRHCVIRHPWGPSYGFVIDCVHYLLRWDDELYLWWCVSLNMSPFRFVV